MKTEMIRHTFEERMYLREANPEATLGSLLFIHGLGESGLCFEHLLARPDLKPWRLLVPDLPGYGRSPWSAAEPLMLADHADHLARWLKSRSIGPVIPVGHSMGGIVALLLAERHPELVKALVDVDGNKSLDDCVFSGQAVAQPQDRFLDTGFDDLRHDIFIAGQDDLAQRGYYVSLRLADPRAFYLNSRELVAMSQAGDLARRLAELAPPRFYVAGVPGGAAEASHRMLAQAEVPCLKVSPSGHWPFLDQPNQFMRVLLACLHD